VRTRHPTGLAFGLVPGRFQDHGGIPGCILSPHLRLREEFFKYRFNGGGKDISWLQQNYVLPIPCRGTRALIVCGTTVLQDGLLPPIRAHGNPEQPQACLGINEQHGIAVRNVRCVSHEKHWTPRLAAFLQSRTLNQHVICSAFPGAVKPTRQHIPVGTFHNAAGVNVFFLQRKDGDLQDVCLRMDLNHKGPGNQWCNQSLHGSLSLFV
jgi:hypothetical protein